MTASKMINKSTLITLLFCLIACVALSLPSRADTIDETEPDTRPTAASLVKAYYSRCLNTVYRDMAPETREEFCACTAAHIKDALKPAELETMATGKGQPVDKKTLAVKVMA